MPKTQPKQKNKTVAIVMPVELADKIQARADSISLSTTAYCRMVLRDHLKSGRKLTLKEG